MDVLTIKGLCKSFGDKQVLKGVELSVPKNSIFGFIGKNGAGKTTVMKCILGLIPTDAGEIFVSGERVAFGDTPTNRFIGYLPDVPEFYSFMTAREYLSFSADLMRMEKDAAAARVDELLELVGLSGEKHRIKGFSRGMKQRLGIAVALLSRPMLLLCDEPTSALDPVGRREILDLLVKLKNETTVLFSTHILSDVERICTDVVFLNDGKIVCLNNEERFISYPSQFVIQACHSEGIEQLSTEFGTTERIDSVTAVFDGGEERMLEAMRFIAEKRIAVRSIERLEPTLERLFMEVTT